MGVVVEEKYNKLVSVITPAFNSARFIEETIQSVQNQTYPHWEMIIVDDCSTDETVKIIQEYATQDKRIKLIQLMENSGPAVARNTAIRNSRGRYIAFLDSDDQWLPKKLEKQLQFMEEKGIAFSFTKYRNVDENGVESGTIIEAPEVVSYSHLLKQNMIGCLTVMLDKTKVGNVEMVNIRSRQDYALWLSLCKKGFQAYGLQEVLAKYREVGNSLSSNKLKMAKQNWKLYREIEKLGFLKSSWYFLHYVYYKVRKYTS
ncbi:MULTISPECIES: glycosyltransferase family 2 protein [Bacillaceae]|uniref:Glycosyltransferase family 2 protein n=1 Tax=Evansella alkalicola TaxID=745819 RepID=A0ABS6JVU1_9BACI|nr:MULTISPECIES: glycosyltransferase family 2 protein [Bacillaceae]MBU9722708.1 glycosyltransferase family 2 protein [Bacillus alkalicola]